MISQVPRAVVRLHHGTMAEKGTEAELFFSWVSYAFQGRFIKVDRELHCSTSVRNLHYRFRPPSCHCCIGRGPAACAAPSYGIMFLYFNGKKTE